MLADFDSVEVSEAPSWNCPKCRFDYEPNSSPNDYLCYCGKVRDPENDPWLLPHSCGQVCGRQLKPKCAHTCLLLCHPGPCPPCPAFVKETCFCGKSTPVPVRCTNRGWSCDTVCGKLLNCQRHKCKLTCHSGNCEPCDAKITRKCRCESSTAERPCIEEYFTCEKVCGKRLPCGRHNCQEKCHPPGPCPPCPLTLPRKCPCGKTSVSGLSCDVEMTPSCFETCEKLLSCNEHKCFQRCHTGDCGACRETVTVRCRCGAKQKSVLCCQAQAGQVTCETKCQKMKSCGRHPCKKKCCPGDNCPPCDQVCNRPLSCGKHKCQSRCHRSVFHLIKCVVILFFFFALI